MSNTSQSQENLPTPTTKSGALKHALLQQTDWAAVSLARPLEIRFASAEERERFGKRRKLTDSDRKRLSVDHGASTLPGFFKSRKTGLGGPEHSIGQIKVHINGQHAGSHLDDNEVSATLPSSHSMLLDHEGFMSPFSSNLEAPQKPPQEKLWNCGTCRLSLPPSHSRTPLRKQEPPATIEGHGIEPSSSFDLFLAQALGSRRENSINQPPHHSQVKPIRNRSPVNSYQHGYHSPLGNPPHFTIGDQLLAEQLQPNVTPYLLQQSFHEPACSPQATFTPSPTILLADVPGPSLYPILQICLAGCPVHGHLCTQAVLWLLGAANLKDQQFMRS